MSRPESLADACNAGSDPGFVAHSLSRAGDPRSVGWSGAFSHPDAPSLGSGRGQFREPIPLGLSKQAATASALDPRSPAGRQVSRAEPATIPSGAHWVTQFPGSSQDANLEPGFRLNVQEFKKALQAAGATTRTTSTYRPPERAYLMHWSWMIVKMGVDPQDSGDDRRYDQLVARQLRDLEGEGARDGQQIWDRRPQGRSRASIAPHAGQGDRHARFMGRSPHDQEGRRDGDRHCNDAARQHESGADRSRQDLWCHPLCPHRERQTSLVNGRALTGPWKT